MKMLRLALVPLMLAAVPLAPHPLAQAQVSTMDSAMASSAIINAGKRAAQVRAIRAVPSIGVIRLDFRRVPSLLDDAQDAAVFRILAQRNAAGVAKLQQALRANPATRIALERHGILISRVAGVQVSSTGALRLYIFSR